MSSNDSNDMRAAGHGELTCVEESCPRVGAVATSTICVACGGPAYLVPADHAPIPGPRPSIRPGDLLGRIFYGGFWAGAAVLAGLGSLVAIGKGNAVGLLGLILTGLAAWYAVYIFRGGRFRIMFW
jgi:hypothetical protein